MGLRAGRWLLAGGVASGSVLLLCCATFGEASAVADAGADGPVGAEGAAGDAGDPGLVTQRRCASSAKWQVLPRVTLLSDRLRSARRLDTVAYFSERLADSRDGLGAADISTSVPAPQPDLVAALARDGSFDDHPTPTPDGTFIFYQSKTASDAPFRIWRGERKDKKGPFTTPRIATVEGLGTTDGLEDPYVAGRRLFFVHKPSGGPRMIFVGDIDEKAGDPLIASGRAVAELSSPEGAEDHPVATADLQEIFFASKRRGDHSKAEIFHAVRNGQTFGPPVAVEELTVALVEDRVPTWISPDACDLYVLSEPENGPANLLQATRRP